jgi:hypothetical protein
MSFLKPKPATSTSGNVNNNLITSTYGGQMGAGTGATNFLAQLLGVSPGAVSSTANGIGTAANGVAEAGGADAGYRNYLQMAGYAPAMRALSQDVTGQGAAAGILNSGSTAKALQTRGTELNNQFFNNYLQQLSGLSGLGLQAGGLVANTGQTSNSKGGSPSTAGTIGSVVGGLAGFSRIDGLSGISSLFAAKRMALASICAVTSCRSTRRLMVMADEVAKLRPWALGPTRADLQRLTTEPSNGFRQHSFDPRFAWRRSA